MKLKSVTYQVSTRLDIQHKLLGILFLTVNGKTSSKNRNVTLKLFMLIFIFTGNYLRKECYL